jgi:hypothetical protein
MGDDTPSAASPAPAATVNRNAGVQLALALTVFALVLASNSIINESWLTTTAEPIGGTLTVDYSLTEFNSETCIGDVCETQVEDYSSSYEGCTELMENATNSEKNEACGEIKDFYNAGYVATIMLIVGSIILFVATIMQVRSMIGVGQSKSNLISAIGGIWVGLSVLVWFLILPDTDTDPNWGQGLWMALVAASSGLIAGFSGTIQSWIDGPPRMRANGVRSGTEMTEFILKESSCGDRSLSILVDSELIRVVKVERVGASAVTKDVLATRRDSYTGFSHQRLDWLDDFKGIWWVIGGASLISSFMISTLFLVPFTIAAMLALLQLMDPERFVVSTNSGNHPFYINRWRSNRELTNLAMDLVDDAMITVLRGEKLDTVLLDTRADLIAERFSADRDAKQEAEQAAAAEKEAFIAAANVIPEPPVMEAVTPPSESTPPPEQVAEEPQDMEMNWTTTEATEGQPEAPAAEQTPPEEAAEEVAEEVAEEAAEETPEAAPVSVPAVTIPPPPPLPATPALELPPLPSIAGIPTPLPPAGVPMMPPMAPLQPVAPPPPGLAGIPAPPPPAGAPMMPPMAPLQPVAPPPPIVVQAAPREDNLSNDEKDNLLGELS